LKIFIKI